MSERLELGGDPEFYAITKTGRAISAHNHEDIVKKVNIGRGGSVVRDGAAFEINPAPSGCRDTFVPNAGLVLKRLSEALPDYELSCAPVVELLKKELKGAPQDVLRGGCDPDYDAYTLSQKAPYEYQDNYRYTAGHLHLGFGADWSGKQYLSKATLEAPSDKLLIEAANAIKVLDIALGIPIVAMLGKTYADGEAWRRRFYGQAGSFRLQPHGIEYRVPSARLWLSPIMMHAVLGLTQLFRRNYGQTVEQNIMGFVQSSNTAPITALLDELSVRQIIDSHDASTAQAFWFESLRPLLVRLGGAELSLHNIRPTLYATIAPSFVTIDAIIRADMDGVHFVNSLKNNWGLYPNFTIVDHAYLGNQAANWGLFDDLFFPQINHVENLIRVPSMVPHPSTSKRTGIKGPRAGEVGNIENYQFGKKVTPSVV